MAMVENVHPGWLALVKTPEFKDWHAKQPAEIRALSASPRADDAILLLNTYKSSPAWAALKSREQLAQPLAVKQAPGYPSTKPNALTILMAATAADMANDKLRRDADARAELRQRADINAAVAGSATHDPARPGFGFNTLRSESTSGNLRYCKYDNGIISTVGIGTICPVTSR
ncbi:MAG TPA: hypothetical protein VIT92_11920 [Burkholderiaceae bacterium]